MHIDAYLERIGLERPATADLASLTRLHRAHLLAIPYENLDVQFGTRLTTSPQAAFDKLVTRRRGGWCYEMNGLLGWALGELGFDVTRSAGAVMREAMGEMSEGNHLVLNVMLPEGRYLADVGFGDGPIKPIRIGEGEFSDGRFTYGLSRVDGRWWRLRNHPEGGAPSFDFTFDRAAESLLGEKCEFLQVSPLSPFVQNLVVQRHTEEGVTILRGRTLRHVTPTGTRERLIAGAEDLIRILNNEFALDMPEAATLWPKIVDRHETLFGAPADER